MSENTLFPDFEDRIEREWNDMPEFKHEYKEPVKQLIVSFKTFDNYKLFAKLINQPLTKKTQSVWYPKTEIETYADKVYINEK